MRFDEITKDDSLNIRHRLAELGRELLDYYDASPEGQEENIGTCRAWALKEIPKSRDRILTVVFWTDDKGARRTLHFPGKGDGPSHIPANARRFSNYRSQEARVANLQELVGVCDRMLSYFAAGAPLDANYLQILDDALAVVPDEDVLEGIEPKVKE